MRSQDKAIFLEAARQFQIWILVPRTGRHWNMWAGPDTRRNELIARGISRGSRHPIRKPSSPARLRRPRIAGLR